MILIENALIGLVTSGVYYLAGRHLGWRKEKKNKEEQRRQEIRNNFEAGLKRAFPAIWRDVIKGGRLGDNELEGLQELFWRADQELEEELRQMLSPEIALLCQSDSYGGSRADVHSAEAIGRVLKQLRDKKGLKDRLSDETIGAIVPGLIVRMLREIGSNAELRETFELIESIRNAHLRDTLSKFISESETLCDETIVNAVNACRSKLYRQSEDAYSNRLAGNVPEFIGCFDYVAPGMKRVQRTNGRIPSDFDKHVTGIGHESFMSLLVEKKRVLVIAGAGVGKTTFLRRLQLDLLKRKLKDAPLPVLEEADYFLKGQKDLHDRISAFLEKIPVIGFNSEKAGRISRTLNEHGRLCFLLDSLDQTSDFGGMQKYFQEEATQFLGDNIVVVACRKEQIASAVETYRRYFGGDRWEWIILDTFTNDQLVEYLGPNVIGWLKDECKAWHGDFVDLLQTAFYANIARRIGLRPDKERKKVGTRVELLGEFMDDLFREARKRGVEINLSLGKRNVLDFLCRLSLDTLRAGHKQVFPEGFVLEKYSPADQSTFEKIFDAQWISRNIFEGRDKERYTFYHQLLQEYFAACRLHNLFTDVKDGPKLFDEALVELPFSTVVLGLLDELLPDASAFNHCMKTMMHALDVVDQDERGIEDTGHKFTWLLALRDRKGEKPELKERLQAEFDAETSKIRDNLQEDGDFVLVPAGHFVRGSYEHEDEWPVSWITLSDYEIEKNPVTNAQFIEFLTDHFKRTKSYKGSAGEEFIHFDWSELEESTEGLTTKGGYEDHPVVGVTWHGAQAYCKWKSAVEKKEYRLPTEAEWEKAARGCLGRSYPWGNDFSKEKCNVEESGINDTSKIGSYPNGRSPYGCQDMVGNVWEWCQDDYQGDFYSKGPKENPMCTESQEGTKVLRGGSWFDDQGLARCVDRFRNYPGDRVRQYRVSLRQDFITLYPFILLSYVLTAEGGRKFFDVCQRK